MKRFFKRNSSPTKAPSIWSLKRHPNDAGLKRESVLSLFRKSKKKDPLGVTRKKK